MDIAVLINCGKKRGEQEGTAGSPGQPVARFCVRPRAPVLPVYVDFFR